MTFVVMVTKEKTKYLSPSPGSRSILNKGAEVVALAGQESLEKDQEQGQETEIGLEAVEEKEGHLEETVGQFHSDTGGIKHQYQV